MSKIVLENMSFKSGMDLIVTGVVKPNPVRFSINVGHSEHVIGMHVNPRFNYHGDTNTIVLNSKVAEDHWEEEQRDCNFPFYSRQGFEITISFDIYNFYVSLSDGNTVQFPNRHGEDEFKYIFIEGDADITGLKVQ